MDYQAEAERVATPPSSRRRALVALKHCGWRGEALRSETRKLLADQPGYDWSTSHRRAHLKTLPLDYVAATRRDWQPPQSWQLPARGLAAALLDSAASAARRRARTRPRERRVRRVSRTSGSRGDPDPEDDPDDLTALQRAHLDLLGALCIAAEDGLRTYLTLLDLAAIKIAAEIARLNDWSEA